ALTIEELRGFLRSRFPEYMIPSQILLVKSIPLLDNGKIDRKALAALKPAESGAAVSRIRARDSVEAELVKLWESLLGKKPVGVSESFYDLGGHSLLAVRLVAEIESAFGKKID